MPTRDTLAIVREYHDQTKHQFNRFARSLGYLDWATQPNPFRAFDGARRVDLADPLLAVRAGAWARVGYDDLFCRPEQPRVDPGLPAVSTFLRYSLGLSAWKQAGPSRWALRVNPSSGNLHPTEGYVVLGGGVAGPRPGVYHYAPDDHALDERCAFDDASWTTAMAALPDGAFLAGLTSIHWREAWKYGERAFRYCQHDIGHAVAAMRMAAALMGWEFRLVGGWSSSAMSTLLGLDRDADFADAEREEPACLAVVSPVAFKGAPRGGLRDAVLAGAWTGRANRLSPGHVQWDRIDAVAEASRHTGSTTSAPIRCASVPLTPSVEVRPVSTGTGGPNKPGGATSLILQRRSAQAMDGRSSLDRDRFVFILRRLMPESGPPFDALDWDPCVHLALFVHRVNGLEPGIYVLVRTPGALTRLQASLHRDFGWIRPAGVPEDLPLYLLAPVDCRRIARQLSCGQDIAADGFFSLGMLADFDRSLEERGASFYRNLYWEAGVIGQALYLEAEAAAARGTGIGCFFDDGVHETLGISDHRFQSLYHFTVGMPVDDARLTTSPGYSWQ